MFLQKAVGVRLEWGHEDLAVPFAANRLGFDRGFGPCTSGVVMQGDDVAAVLVFHNFHPEAGVIEVSAVAENAKWAQRGVLKQAFGYIYDKLQCQMAVARCDVSNGRVRRLWKAFGASEHIIPRLRGREADEAILTLTDDAWRASRFAR